MARIDVTAAIRKSPDDILSFLLDLGRLHEYLPAERFRGLPPATAKDAASSQPALTRCTLDMQVLNRWWGLELNASRPGTGLEVHWNSQRPVALDVRFSLSPLKADRRGPRTALRLHVGYELPGGLLGKVVDRILIEREMLKIWDQVIRQLVIALEGKPKSGLKHEDPEA